MLYGTKTVIEHKIGLLNLAEELGNVSKACKLKNRGSVARTGEMKLNRQQGRLPRSGFVVRP